ncbi:YeiH family putative sulfate export transporter [Spirabiliibacterium falconis]|uniref:YeiH family putative sulfate export transporter n=1 Tax=Spirabiliibacterium falconis TaxID=572023 RepID=UPI001AAD8D12|nr:YeiH family putative sulfate export transporter [Spirabiliibacterium falconis]MBE2894500.1 YeiH family putative sulfate export transporter [Spirabiliibacterium falconis]
MLNKILNYTPGLLLAGVITALAFWLNANHVGSSIGMSALTFAILLGMVIGNTVYGRVATRCHSGITFAKGVLLRAGIVLYGFRITFQQIDAVGLNAIASDAIMLISTFFLTFYLGYKWLKIDKQIVYLSAAGCSICGAAAVMASEPVVRGESSKVAVAIAIVVIFGTIAMFVYPLLYPYMTHYLSDHQFGIYIGSSVHEVAQVYAAGGNINPMVADDAVITKMIRVMMLAPFLLVLSYALAKESAVGGKRKINIPWFAVFFILVAVLNSYPIVPEPVVHFLVELDGILLMMAMAALGVTTHIGAIKQAGAKPLVLGFLVFIWLVVGGFVVNYALQYVF